MVCIKIGLQGIVVQQLLYIYYYYYSGVFYCHNCSLSLFSHSLSLSHTHTHSGEEVKMKLLLGPKWWCIIATVVEIHLWMLAKKFSMHVTFWFHQCCVPLSNYYLWWWLWNRLQWVVGGGVLRERSWARKCNGSRCLGSAFLPKGGNICSSHIRQV